MLRILPIPQRHYQISIINYKLINYQLTVFDFIDILTQAKNMPELSITKYMQK